MTTPAIRNKLAEKFRLQKVTDRIIRIAERDPYKLTPFIYLIKADIGMECNMGVVIDTGTGWGNLAQFLKDNFHLGTAQMPTVLVINTHNHFDHVGCNYQFASPEKGKSSFCTDVCMGDHDPNYTNNYAPTHKNAVAHGANFKNYVITRWLKDGEKIYLSHNPLDYLEILHIPGHTPDSVAIYFAAERRLFVGDFVYRGHDIIATATNSCIRDFETSAKKLLRFVEKEEGKNEGKEILMCCGHMNTMFEVKSLKKFVKLLEDINTGRAEGEGLVNRRFVCDTDPHLSIVARSSQLMEGVVNLLSKVTSPMAYIPGVFSRN